MPQSKLYYFLRTSRWGKLSRVVIYCLFAILACGALGTPIVNAHGITKTLEQQVGDVIVKVGYDEAHANLGDPAQFYLSLEKSDRSDAVSFDSVLVRIRPQEDEYRDVFNANVRQATLGPTTVTYDFPKTGVYKLTVRYFAEGKTLAEHTFDFPFTKPISKEDAKQTSYFGKYFWIVSLVGGFTIGLVLKGSRRPQERQKSIDS
jgi:hypothetical protein